MIRVVIDTNILVSALLQPESLPVRPTYWTLAAGRSRPLSVTLESAITGASVDPNTPGATGGFVPPNPVPYSVTYCPGCAGRKPAPGNRFEATRSVPVKESVAITGLCPSLLLVA